MNADEAITDYLHALLVRVNHEDVELVSGIMKTIIASIRKVEYNDKPEVGNFIVPLHRVLGFFITRISMLRYLQYKSKAAEVDYENKDN